MNREDIIRMAMNVDGHMNDRRGGIDLSWDSLVRIVQTAIAAERETCAKHAEDFLTRSRSPLGRAVGDAIRARGKQ